MALGNIRVSKMIYWNSYFIVVTTKGLESFGGM
jgi:hypothetical protein